MTQLKDPAIKLFGKTIPFCAADGDESGGVSCSDNDRASSAGSEIVVKVLETQTVEGRKQQGGDESANGIVMIETKENQRTPFNDEFDNANAGSSNITEETNSNEKASLKKPDKALPCPRCNSMDTKFCYYNNYNVLQPRHFCKGCQRYWTAGGAMRNVPVGAGRRKSKNAAAQNRYLATSDVFRASGTGSPNGMVTGHPGLKCGSVLLTAGSEAIVSATNGTMPNLTQATFLDRARNLNHEVIDVAFPKSHKLGELNSSRSCIMASNETGSDLLGCPSLAPSFNGCVAQVPCIPTLSYPWNAAIPPPPFPHPGFAVPIFPSNYWPCSVIPNTLNAPWPTPLSPLQTTSTVVGGNLNSMPSTLGKHSRDGQMLTKYISEKLETAKQPSVLTPKTLRIDHPEEAAKSSIWETLGIKNETLSKGGIFRDFKSKEMDKIKHVPENYPHLSSNPAALSRSLNYQEVS